VGIGSSMPMAWHVDGEPPDAVAFSDKRLTDDEAEKLARLIVSLPELIELERERNKAKSRRRSPPPDRPVTLGDLARDGKHLRPSTRPVSHPYISISSPSLSGYQSGCRCRRWRII
jgi:hypothetical protein